MFLSPGDRGGRQSFADGQGGYIFRPWTQVSTGFTIEPQWNANIALTGVKINALKALSNNAGKIIDFQVSGSSKAFIDENGNLAVNGTLLAIGGSVITYDGNITASSSGRIGFSSGTPTASSYAADALFTRGGVATLQQGAADAATPVAQTLQVQSSNSANNAGANWTFTGSKSAGAGASGSIIFKTGATGASSGTTNTIVQALQIGPATTNNTNVGYPSVIQGAGAAVATTATDGFLYIASCAGTPSGVPTSYTGSVPMVFDTTGVKLWIYTGGAWKGVVVA